MLSLRSKKSKVKSDSGQRRSTRTMVLEGMKTEKATQGVTKMDSLQVSDHIEANIGKQGRREKEAYTVEDATGSSCNSSFLFKDSEGNTLRKPPLTQRQSDITIQCILDMLEVKDTMQLFILPNDFLTNYSERISNPGDFATLRQKHKDRMYHSLEQFESDVYMVFQKAIYSNCPESMPYKEAINLLELSKRVFQSLKYNPTYSELELQTWHQKYFPNKRRALRSDTKMKNPVSTIQVECVSNPGISDGMNQTDSPMSTKESKRTQPFNDLKHLSTAYQSKVRSYWKKDNLASSKSSEEYQRHTYKIECDKNELILPMDYNQQQEFPNISLLNFVKNAGPAAKRIAEKKCLEYDERKAQFISSFREQKVHINETKFLNIGSSSATSNTSELTTILPSFSKEYENDHLINSRNKEAGFSNFNPKKFDDPPCNLDPNGLLRLFKDIGTPTFLEKSERILGRSVQTSKDKEPFSLLTNDKGSNLSAESKPNLIDLTSEAKKELLSTVVQRHNPSQTFYDLMFLKKQLEEKKISRQITLASSDTNPKTTPKTPSSTMLGFSQYAKNIQPFKLDRLNFQGQSK